MAVITFVLAILSKLRVSNKDLDFNDPISVAVVNSKGVTWPRFIWRRAALIAAEYLESPSVSKELASKIMIYCVLKVPDSPRLQLSAAGFFTKLKQQKEDSLSENEKIFEAIAGRFSNNIDAQRTLSRVMIKARGQRFVQDSLLDKVGNETISDAIIRAHCLQDLGAFTSADDIWHKVIEKKNPDYCLLYAESLINRGYLGKAADVLSGLKSPEVSDKLDLIYRRLNRAEVQDDTSLYLPGLIADKYFDNIRIKRERLPKLRQIKKIVIVNASLGRGGAERQCVNTAIEISRQRPDLSVEVWVRNLNHRKSRNALLPELKLANVKVRAFEGFPNQSHSLHKKWPEIDIEQLNEDLHFLSPTLYRVYNGLCKHRPDVIHLWQDATISLIGLAALLSQVPKIALSFRSIPPPLKGTDRPYYKPLIKGIANMPSVYVSANTQVGAEYYADWLDIDKKRIKIILNGLIHTNFMDISKKAPVLKTIVGIMRLDENKRPDDWVRVANEVLKQSNGVKFRLLGHGPLLHEIKMLTCNLNIEDKVEIMGDVQEVSPILRNADILLHLSKVEGLPNVVMEAQAHGCAVIATDAGGTREAFIPGKTGVLLDNAYPLDIQKIAQNIVDLINDPEQLEAFQTSARNVAAEKFSLKKMISHTFDLYEGM